MLDSPHARSALARLVCLLGASFLGLVGACKSDLPAAACEDLFDKAGRGIAAFDAEHLRCEKNEDCTQVSAGGCFPSCETPLAKSAVVDRAALQQRLTDNECAAWKRGGCEKTTPKPMASCVPWTAVCERGRCSTPHR